MYILESDWQNLEIGNVVAVTYSSPIGEFEFTGKVSEKVEIDGKSYLRLSEVSCTKTPNGLNLTHLGFNNFRIG
jgi:hypothetical protein